LSALVGRVSVQVNQRIQGVSMKFHAKGLLSPKSLGLRVGMLAMCLCLGLTTGAAQAQLTIFGDGEARNAILDLRKQVEALQAQANKQGGDQAASAQQLNEQLIGLRRSLLDLQNQIEQLRAELARQRGADEQLARTVAELQRSQRDGLQALDDRLRRLEPQKVTVDGRQVEVTPEERRDFDAAMALFRGSDFAGAASAFAAFQRRYPQSGYADSASFWLGNSHYANKAYREAVATLQALASRVPDSPRAPDALLGVANSQVELKDTRAARATLEGLVKQYPQSEAAVAARERLARLR
jgi:tol-pal system protein YbgF